jgi:thiol-disulfide isomerase/thioredoxin
MKKTMAMMLALSYLGLRTAAQQVQAEAKAENKYIFIDCYATWCGPCKYMVQNIFPNPELGQFVNEHFVSVSVQMDRTKHDGPEVQRWYGVADSLVSLYGVNAYPTFLFFAPDGHIVHRLVGGANEPNVFRDRVVAALDSNQQYYAVIGRYKEHLQDSAFLYKALNLAMSLYDAPSAALIADAYLDCLKDPFTKETLTKLQWGLYFTSGSVFRLFRDNQARIDSVFHSDRVYPVLMATVYLREVDSLAYSGQVVDWAMLSRRLDTLCPYVAKQAIVLGKVIYYKNQKEVAPFETAMNRYMDLCGSRLGDYDRNEAAWNVFLVSSNHKLLERAIAWSKQCIAKYPSPKLDYAYLDTYANLLYKAGDKKDAIIWESRALEAGANNAKQKKVFEETLDKMKRGEKTWEGQN